MLNHQMLYARLICLLVGYLLGSLLTAEVVAKLFTGKSAREIGTGNPGMANILANVGPGAGFAVLAGDALKTAVACLACYYATVPQIGRAGMLYAGLGAILGHNFPVWNRGRGGKGVAVTCVWLLLYLPLTGALCCLAGGALVLWLGYLPLGAVVIPLVAVPVAWLQFGAESGIAVLTAAVLMFSRHYRGLRRIRQGTEKKFFRTS